MDGCKRRSDISDVYGFYRNRSNVDAHALYVDSQKLPDMALSRDKSLISDVPLFAA